MYSGIFFPLNPDTNFEDFKPQNFDFPFYFSKKCSTILLKICKNNTSIQVIKYLIKFLSLF